MFCYFICCLIAKVRKIIIGTVSMPPKWSLGYHQCRYSYDSSEKVLKVFSWQSVLSLSMGISFSKENIDVMF
jgi:hypothetical protein